MGSIGEIIVAGEHVLKEYYNNPEALKRNKIFVGDEVWHRTGDAGYIEDGLLFLTGRCNRMIKDGNEYIGPFLYENLFLSVEGVAIGTILMVNDKITAVVESGGAADQSHIRDHIINLDGRIEELNFISKIPRDPATTPRLIMKD